MPHDLSGVVITAAADDVSTEPEGRTIRARLTTYGTLTRPMGAYGMPVRLAEGALSVPEQLSDVKLLQAHDTSRVIGVMTAQDDEDGAPYGTFRLGRTQDAEDALMNAADGIIDAVSVGYRVTDYTVAREDDEDLFEVTGAQLFEVSLVGHPADHTARIESVTAQREPAMPQNTITTTTAEDAPQLTRADILELVRAELAPAEAAPAVNPEITAGRAPQVVTQDGIPIAFSSQRPGKYPAARGRDGRLYTAGDYFAAYARAANEGQWDTLHTIQAALADEVTGDVPGLLPQAIVGELLGRASGRRPVWDSLTNRDMPMVGEKFSRPKITQHVQVAEQATQKTEVASRKYKVGLDPVTKRTLSGALDVSQQAIDWTSPSLLNELITDFTRIYVARTDVMAATDLDAAATEGAQTVVWDGTAATLTTALATAAGLVYGNAPEESDAFPNTVWLSVDMWVKIAGLVDTSGRPLLPQLGPTNAVGTVDLSNPEQGITGPGFRWVISKNLPEGTMIMGDRTYTESYENGRRFLQAVRPDVIGLDIAYMGYVADYFPYPETLVKIGPAAEGAAAAKK